MALIEWSEKYCIGIAEMDNQHKVLVGIINRFEEASKHSVNTKKNFALFDELLQYTEFHFQAEENYIHQIEYPSEAQHKMSHLSLIERVLEFQRVFKEQNGLITIELLHFLKAWLLSHILKHDTKYAEFAKGDS